MDLKGIQLIAVLKTARLLTLADGRVDAAETELIAKEMFSFGLKRNDLMNFLQQSDVMESSTMIGVLSSMRVDQKKYIAGFLATLALADGDIDDSEVKLWQLICTLIGCPEMTYIEALQFWANK